VLGAAVAMLAGCATVEMYDGPLQRGQEVAVVVTDRTRLDKVDTRRADEGKKFAVLTGLHAVAVYLMDKPATGKGLPRYSEESLAICFVAVARHTYRVWPRYQGKRWQPAVTDETTNEVLTARISGSNPPGCYGPTDSSAEPPSGAAALDPPVGLVQVGWPPGEAGVISAGEGRRTRGSIRVEGGGAFGGDTLASAQFDNGETRTLSAGGGAFLAVGGSITPVWLSNTVGIGLDLDLGVKYQSIGGSNGSIAFVRFPGIASGHVLVAFGDRWALLLRGGAELDLDPTITSDGVAAGLGSFSLSSHLGGMFEAGAYSSSAGGVGWSATVRLTAIDYEYMGNKIAATNLAFVLGGHYDFYSDAR
jgi:hypothetical protein